MDLPDTVTILETFLFLDGGSRELLVADGVGQEHSIHLSQWMFDRPGRGRLYFDRQLVDMRSEEERRIVELIQSADCGPRGNEVDYARWCRREKVVKEFCDSFIAQLLAPLQPPIQHS